MYDVLVIGTGIAGLSVVADSLSAIKYARVKCIRDADGVVVDYEVEGDFPSTATTTTGWTASHRSWWIPL